MSAEPLVRWLAKHHGKRLLVDTNLLLPYLLGCFYRVRVELPPHKAIKDEEFTLVAQIIHHFSTSGTVLTTPHILTEISNLSGHLGKDLQQTFLRFIRHRIQQLEERLDEKEISARRLVGQDYFPRFGLTDAAIIHLAYDSILVLTNDRAMARYLQEEKRRRNVFYFGDLKDRVLLPNE